MLCCTTLHRSRERENCIPWKNHIETHTGKALVRPSSHLISRTPCAMVASTGLEFPRFIRLLSYGRQIGLRTAVDEMSTSNGIIPSAKKSCQYASLTFLISSWEVLRRRCHIVFTSIKDWISTILRSFI